MSSVDLLSLKRRSRRADLQECRVCHQIGDNAKNLIGPLPNNIVGRKVGTIEVFNYSEANKNSGVTWTEETLFAYLEKPTAFMAGTKMAFPGVKDEQGRRDVIAYLKKFSK